MFTRIVSKATLGKPIIARTGLLGMRSFAYDQIVIDHYENPRNVGSFSKKDGDVGTGLVGAPACGDVMKL